MSNLTVVLPERSEDRISTDLRDLTAVLDARNPEDTAHGFLGGVCGYGAEFDCDVFEMHPFWWGDCECGHETREWDWEESNPHAPNCFQSLIDWDAPLEQRWADTKSLAIKMGLDPKFGLFVHCTCGHTERWQAWTEQNPHPADCPVVRPNFRHKASGFEVRWYKYIGRGMEFNREITRDAWREIFNECVVAAQA